MDKKRLRNKCDKLAKDRAMERECGLCESCGSSFMTTAHHYFYRSSSAHLRFDLDNLVILCRACHFALHFKDAKLIELRITAKKGKRWLNKLTKKALEKQRPSYQTLEYYQNILKKLS